MVGFLYLYIFKTSMFDRPTLSRAKWTRHFLQYARRAHASAAAGMHSSSCFQRPRDGRGLKKTRSSSGIHEPACMLAAAAAAD
jgi:hypothetical protein